MSNKILLIMLVLSLSLAAFLAGYLISQEGFAGQPASLNENNILEKFDGTAALDKDFPKDLVALSRNAVVSATLSKEKDSVIYYDRKDGKVFQVSPRDLKEKLVSGTLLPDLVDTVWSPNKKEVVSVFYANEGEKFKYYNYQTQKVVDLGVLIKSAVFSPDGSRLAYFKSQGADGTIYVSAPDGDAPKKIFDTRIADLELYWPSQENLAFKTRTDGMDRVYVLSMTGNLTKIVEEAGPIELLWSPDGSRLLYSVKNGESSPRIKDIASSISSSTGVSTTASRCFWGTGEGYIICSVPRSGTGGEDIYKIGFDGTKELLASPQKSIVVKQLMLTVLEEFAIMVSDLDGKLYALKLGSGN